MKQTKEKSRNHQVTLIVSVLNEAKTIELLLASIWRQTHLPDEVIVVDGGSNDNTQKIIENFLQKAALDSSGKTKRLIENNFIIKTLPNASRSRARNWAIKHATHSLIAITDAGCVLQPSWLEKLLAKYQQTKASIVGGYFFGLPTTPFEQAVVCYTLQTPDRVDPKCFMPTTRSVLLTKQAWLNLHGFDEQLTMNEDFAFFYQARQEKVEIAFAQEALAGWLPRQNLEQYCKMIFSFARGDLQAGIVRPKVQLLFGRYLLVVMAVAWLLARGVAPEKILLVLGFWLGVYLVWAIKKNAKYAPLGWYWLPVLQLAADGCVMTGSVVGLVERYRYQPRV